MLELVLPDPS